MLPYIKSLPQIYSLWEFVFIYRVLRPEPIRFILPSLVMLPKTASTVVGLTSGKILHISDLEIGVRLFSTVASIRCFFVIRLPFTTAKRFLSAYNYS